MYHQRQIGAVWQVLETRGAIIDGTLNGDLVARFGGDPTLSRQDLRNMVAAIKKQGINHIKGNLVTDTSVWPMVRTWLYICAG